MFFPISCDWILAWEPSIVIISPTVYLRFIINFDFTYYFLEKSTLSAEDLKAKLRLLPWIFSVFQSEFEANRSRGSWVKSDKQTDRDYNFIEIDRKFFDWIPRFMNVCANGYQTFWLDTKLCYMDEALI